ncbi:hypothetical protein L0244_20605 [bacterium]|nr:hypothetical protein [bacterium]
MIFIAGVLFIEYPKIKRLFVNESETTQERQTHERTRSSKKLQAGGYIDEVTAFDAYRNLENAIKRSDAEQARKYVTDKRWKEMELEPNEPNAIEELNAGCPVETELKCMIKMIGPFLWRKGNPSL